jgi:SAM-dependent methyltransferase
MRPTGNKEGALPATTSPPILARWLRSFLCFPGVQYLTTRLGGRNLRRWSFDEKFRSGEWNFVSEASSELVRTVERYAGQGNILMLGCGTASLASALNPESFRSLLGVDLSPEAIARARERANHKVRFEVGDMLQFTSAEKFSVIVFSESLYYIKSWQRQKLLERAAQMLAPGGRIVVTVAQPDRFAGMLRMMRQNFQIAEERNFPGSSRRLVVLH